MKVTLELTEEQADELFGYLVLTANFREKEREAWESLGKRQSIDGTLQFPNAPNNAEFWKKQNETIEKVAEILQKARADAYRAGIMKGDETK